MGQIEWIRKGPFGVIVHYLSSILPRHGEEMNDWEDAVANFDVSRFGENITETGAGWVVFPFGQNTGKYCAPNEYLESLLPGSCTQRNLIKEIAEDLSGRNIRLIAYLPAEVCFQSEEVQKALGWNVGDSMQMEFQKRYTKVVRVWAEEMGGLLSGWWIDGCYKASEKVFVPENDRNWDNSRFDQTWFDALRAGNPQTVVAMCNGAGRFEVVRSECDYIAGEANDLTNIPQTDDGLLDGQQWHALVWLDCFWMHGKNGYPDGNIPEQIPLPRFTDEKVANYMAECNQRNGGVTFNIGIYRDGSLAEPTVAQIMRINSGRF